MGVGRLFSVQTNGGNSYISEGRGNKGGAAKRRAGDRCKSFERVPFRNSLLVGGKRQKRIEAEVQSVTYGRFFPKRKQLSIFPPSRLRASFRSMRI